MPEVEVTGYVDIDVDSLVEEAVDDADIDYKVESAIEEVDLPQLVKDAVEGWDFDEVTRDAVIKVCEERYFSELHESLQRIEMRLCELERLTEAANA